MVNSALLGFGCAMMLLRPKQIFTMPLTGQERSNYVKWWLTASIHGVGVLGVMRMVVLVTPGVVKKVLGSCAHVILSQDIWSWEYLETFEHDTIVISPAARMAFHGTHTPICPPLQYLDTLRTGVTEAERSAHERCAPDQLFWHCVGEEVYKTPDGPSSPAPTTSMHTEEDKEVDSCAAIMPHPHLSPPPVPSAADGDAAQAAGGPGPSGAGGPGPSGVGAALAGLGSVGITTCGAGAERPAKRRSKQPIMSPASHQSHNRLLLEPHTSGFPPFYTEASSL